MSRAAWSFRSAVVPLIVVLTACARSAEPAQPQPPVRQIAPPPPEISVITVPVRASLAPLAAEIEARVPRKFTDTTRERGIDVRHEVTRDRIRLNMIGGGLHASTTAKYAIEACRGRFPCISCGFGEPRREAQITMHSSFTWDPSWRLRSRTRLLPVNYARPCEVTWLEIDVTRRFIAPVVEKQLGAAAAIIDRNVPALTAIRSEAEQIWAAIQEPAALGPRTWLLLEPIDVALSPISGAGMSVTTTLLLRTRTRVVLGEKPAVSLKPLPPLSSSGAATSALRVPVDLEVPYDEASRLMSAELVGKQYRIAGNPLRVESVKIGPANEGRLLVEAMIDYRGGPLRNYRGAIYLEGTPHFDPATSHVTFPDLEYSLDPNRRGFIARIVDRAAHEPIRDTLRTHARFHLRPHLDRFRSEVTRALTRQLAPGVQLRGRADAIEPVAVTPLSSGISIRIVATGSAEVDVNWQAR